MGLYGSKDQHPKLVATAYENEHLSSIEWQYCEKCGHKHLKQYKKCPLCGHTHKKIGYLGKIWIFLAIVILLVIIGVYSGIDKTDSDYTPNIQFTATQSSVPTRVINETTEVTNAESTAAKDSAAMTMGQKNALKSAKKYLSFTSFSYEGLIHQLEFEKYTHEEAVYAADNCGADWYTQAVQKAKSYLDLTAFSKESLIDQLEFEGFTREQAEYGVKMNGYE